MEMQQWFKTFPWFLLYFDCEYCLLDYGLLSPGTRVFWILVEKVLTLTLNITFTVLGDHTSAILLVRWPLVNIQSCV